MQARVCDAERLVVGCAGIGLRERGLEPAAVVVAESLADGEAGRYLPMRLQDDRGRLRLAVVLQHGEGALADLCGAGADRDEERLGRRVRGALGGDVGVAEGVPERLVELGDVQRVLRFKRMGEIALGKEPHFEVCGAPGRVRAGAVGVDPLERAGVAPVRARRAAASTVRLGRRRPKG